MPTLTTVTLGRFIRELVTGISPPSILFEEWGLTPDDYAELKKLPAFQQEMRAAIMELKAQGGDAGYIMRMRLLSEEFVGDIEKLVRDEMAPHSVRADLIKFTAEMARLKPEKKNEVPAGTSVNFNFGGNVGKLLNLESPTLEVKPALPTHAPDETQSPAR